MTVDEMITAADEWIASGRARAGKRSVPLYAATQPVGDFRLALLNDKAQDDWYWIASQRDILRMERDLKLLPFIVRALRNDTL